MHINVGCSASCVRKLTQIHTHNSTVHQWHMQIACRVTLPIITTLLNARITSYMHFECMHLQVALVRCA